MDYIIKCHQNVSQSIVIEVEDVSKSQHLKTPESTDFLYYPRCNFLTAVTCYLITVYVYYESHMLVHILILVKDSARKFVCIIT